MNIKTAELIVGGLTITTKMPGASYSLPARACITGGALRKVENSVCNTCYALKGNYARYPAIFAAQYRRLDAITHPNWVNAMVYLMHNKTAVKKSGFFRWHDSGDIQSAAHLTDIVTIAKLSPRIKFWIPTKEKALIKAHNGVIPDNLIIRLSGTMLDGKKPLYPHISLVTTDKTQATCGSFNTHGACGDCRACWDKSIESITYLKH